MCYAKKKSTYPIAAPIAASTSVTSTGSPNNIYVLAFLKDPGMEERKSMMKSGMRVLEGRYVRRKGYIGEPIGKRVLKLVDLMDIKG